MQWNVVALFDNMIVDISSLIYCCQLVHWYVAGGLRL